MLSLPPHSSHRMQPLDVTYFKPLSSYFNQAADRWIRMHVGRAIQVRHIGGLLAEAFSQASMIATAVKGFEKTGIWPPNRNVFSDDDFFATSVARGDAMPTDKAACTQPASPPPPPPGAEQQANNHMSCVTPPNLHEATSEPESTQQQEQRNNEMAQPESTQPHEQRGNEMAQPESTQQLQQLSSPITHTTTDGQMTPASNSTDLSTVQHSPEAMTDVHQSSTTLASATNPEKHRRITVKGDGRCCFRSIIVATTDDPQIVGSKDDRYASQLLDMKEGVLADGLRASLMAYMIEHISDLNALLGPNAIDVLNADVPDNIRFGTVEKRILHMANVTASVGELEIVSVRHLQRTIVILDEQFEPIREYDPEEAVSSVQRNAKKGTVTLQFQKLGPNIGHYNAVLVDSEHSSPSSRMATSSVQLAQSAITVKAKDILPLPKKSPIVSQRKRICQQAELITSSPVKRNLQSQQCRSKPVQKTKEKQPKRKPMKQKQSRYKKVGQEESWFCNVCAEDVQ